LATAGRFVHASHNFEGILVGERRMSFDNFNADANKVFGYHPASGFKVKASHRLALNDALTASLYTRLSAGKDSTFVSLVPKFKVCKNIYCVVDLI
jgi:hypothetical protein